MSDVSSLRNEIKSWERNFRATHGREPSVQDIKEQPGLAQKYKQYKKLTKATETGASSTHANPPSTPPRAKAQSRPSAHPSLLLAKPRDIAAAQPLSGYNPFSPQKNKGKQKAPSPDAHLKPEPFRLARAPSLDPVPRLSFASASASTSATAADPFSLTPNNAVSRARKRLRGEPVSPSPNKEKRQRMRSPQSDDEDDDPGAANGSFVDDSPVKPPVGIRSFKLLFDETAAKPKFPVLRLKPLFGEKALLTDGSERMDLDDVPMNSERASTPKLSTAKMDPFLDSADTGNVSPIGDVTAQDRPAPQPPTRSLLAPSPPPKNQRSSGKAHIHNAKGRAKSNGEGQKKESSGSEADEDDEDVETDGNGSQPTKVRLFDRTESRRRAHGDDGSDDDTYRHISRRPPDTEPAPQPQASESISVPDTLLSVLSLASTSAHGAQEKHVVEELLYGTRRRNYDPSKGGEVWGVGEFEEEDRDEFALGDGQRASMREVYDDGDDWEGEGVPWEVGEL
ncbi:hypothetical protein B0H15DRAFT_204902 [Mycena belliarum]|uniref:DNA replication regulator SLD2 n=1 Tax=Mycena belliarum TaxID=1033014 RepID=A0AAD6Y1M9_9AGAR|nr:hypothetical protein B0H15DRAFT_204902 [Mycena belliae]